MKLSRIKLKKIIKEELDIIKEEKVINLSLTQREANKILIALEELEQTDEIKALYNKVLDAGLGGGFGQAE